MRVLFLGEIGPTESQDIIVFLCRILGLSRRLSLRKIVVFISSIFPSTNNMIFSNLLTLSEITGSRKLSAFRDALFIFGGQKSKGLPFSIKASIS